MTKYLPPNLLALFAPRDPLEYIPPAKKLLHEKRKIAYTGIAFYVKYFDENQPENRPRRHETRHERKERKVLNILYQINLILGLFYRKRKAEIVAYKIEQGIAMWNPLGNSLATGDPFKTLFVARMNFDTSESKLKRELSEFGMIKKIIMIQNKISKKPRGYAFIEYEREKDMHSAYKRADGRKIDGRRIVVDVERGRTVKGWLPRRFGSGIGNTRKAVGPGTAQGDARENDREEERRRSKSRSKERRRRSRTRSRSREHRRRSRRSRERRDRDGRSAEKRARYDLSKVKVKDEPGLEGVRVKSEKMMGSDYYNRMEHDRRDSRSERNSERRSHRERRDENDIGKVKIEKREPGIEGVSVKREQPNDEYQRSSNTSSYASKDNSFAYYNNSNSNAHFPYSQDKDFSNEMVKDVKPVISSMFPAFPKPVPKDPPENEYNPYEQ